MDIDKPKEELNPDAPKPEAQVPDETKVPVAAKAGVELPAEVTQALVALYRSVEGIVPNVRELADAEQQEPAPDAETPAEDAAEAPAETPAPAGDKPQAASQPGVSQGMSPQNPGKEEDKPTFSQKAVEDMISKAVGEATKSLKERLAVIEAQPASDGPVIRPSAVKAYNPRMGDTIPEGADAQKSFYDAILNDPHADSTVKTYAGRNKALLEMEAVFAAGPQRPR